MVLAFLSAIAVVGSMEAFRTAHGDAQLTNVMFVVVCAVAAGAIRRSASLLGRAEEGAHQGRFPGCGDYGRFQVVGHRPRLHEIDLRCRSASATGSSPPAEKSPGAPRGFHALRSGHARGGAPQLGVAHVLDQLLGLLVRRRRQQADQTMITAKPSGTPNTPAEIGWMPHQMLSAIGEVTPNMPRIQGCVVAM